MDGRQGRAIRDRNTFQRLLLDHMVELLVEIEVIGMHGVERHLRAVDEFHLRGIGRLAQRINLEPFAEHFRGRVRLAIHQEAAQGNPIDVRRRLRHEVFAAVLLCPWGFRPCSREE